MIYRAIGIMSGSSLDGLDIAFVEFDESRSNWSYEVKAADCYPFEKGLKEQLKNAINLSAKEYLLLHTSFGRYIGEQVKKFIDENNLHHRVQLISSHGHTTFHMPQQFMTAQLGEGSAIAAATGINVVSDLRNMDISLGGQGAPIVPMGEKLLWSEYNYWLNLGGIANISMKKNDETIAFDICAANRVMNMIAEKEGKEYDENGNIAASGLLHTELLTKLNEVDYYKQAYPKSLANDFGTDVIFPLVEKFNLSNADALRTYVEHIAQQISYSILSVQKEYSQPTKLLATGGGAMNTFLTDRIRDNLRSLNIELVIPDANTISYKEAIVMALLGVLRWREENTIMNSVTGALRSSIGGAVWIGQEA
jgi:anhydro-N-acetylmuramic acid kinase